MNVLIYDEEIDSYRPGVILMVREGEAGATPWDGVSLAKDGKGFIVVWAKPMRRVAMQQDLADQIAGVETCFDRCWACGHTREDHKDHNQNVGRCYGTEIPCDCSVFVEEKKS